MKKTQTKTIKKKSEKAPVEITDKELGVVTGGRRIIVYSNTS
jgi:hypothetical protein